MINNTFIEKRDILLDEDGKLTQLGSLIISIVSIAVIKTILEEILNESNL